MTTITRADRGVFASRYRFTDIYLYGNKEIRLAEHKASGRTVAVKVFFNKSLRSTPGGRTRPAHRHRTKALSLLMALDKVSHNNIIKPLWALEEPDAIYVVMEHIQGQSLRELIPDLSEGASRDIIRQLIEILAFCHEKAIAHRHLTIDNIIFDEEGMMKLADFTLAKSLETKYALMEDTVGTLEFIAPEVASGLPYDFKCDVWAIGVVAYTMLSRGTLPFSLSEFKDLGSKQAATEALMEKLKSGEWDFKPEDAWAQVSEVGKDLVKKLLVPDADIRADYSQARGHPWFRTSIIVLHENVDE